MSKANNRTEKELKRADKELQKLQNRLQESENQLSEIQGKINAAQEKRDHAMAEVLAGNKTDQSDIIALDKELESLQKSERVQKEIIERQRADLNEQKRRVYEIEQKLASESKADWVEEYYQAWDEFLEVMQRLRTAQVQSGMDAGPQAFAHKVYSKALGTGVQARVQAADPFPKSEVLSRNDRFEIEQVQKAENAPEVTSPQEVNVL